MGFDSSPFDQDSLDVPGEFTAILFEETISSKENTNVLDGANFYRNAEVYAGTLMIDLPAPTAATENLDVITVFVDPVTHPSGTDILPNPGDQPGVIWIDGERIEYRDKVISAANTWELRLVRRGTMGTAPTEHLALVPMVDEVNSGPDGQTILVDPPVYVGNSVWVEKFNNIPGIPDEEIWNVTNLPAIPDPASEQSPSVFTSVLNVPLGGLWYAQTPEAMFLKEKIGKSIP